MTTVSDSTLPGGKGLTPFRRLLYKKPLDDRSLCLISRGKMRMGIFGELIMVVAQVFNLIATLYIYIVVARAIISWVNPDPYNPIVRFLHSATDPLLNRIRRALPISLGAIDFSPIILLFGVFLLQRIVMIILTRVAYSL